MKKTRHDPVVQHIEMKGKYSRNILKVSNDAAQRRIQYRTFAQFLTLRYFNILKLQEKGFAQLLFFKNGVCGIVNSLKTQQNNTVNIPPLKGRQKCCAIKLRNHFLPFSPYFDGRLAGSRGYGLTGQAPLTLAHTARNKFRLGLDGNFRVTGQRTRPVGEAFTFGQPVTVTKTVTVKTRPHNP